MIIKGGASKAQFSYIQQIGSFLLMPPLQLLPWLSCGEEHHLEMGNYRNEEKS